MISIGLIVILALVYIFLKMYNVNDELKRKDAAREAKEAAEAAAAEEAAEAAEIRAGAVDVDAETVEEDGEFSEEREYVMWEEE